VSGVPRLVIEVAVEGRAVARLDAESLEDQQRLSLELHERDLVGEILDALAAALEQAA
jgi:hypothetical protein